MEQLTDRPFHPKGAHSTWVIALGAAAMLCAHLSCRETPTGPTKRNPRNYEWSATTFSYPNAASVAMYAVWGSSPSNVIAAGRSSMGANGGAIWRFNGTTWKVETGIPINANDFHDIIGFSTNDMWMPGEYTYLQGLDVRDSAVVLHYNGATWSQVLPGHMNTRALHSAWGTPGAGLYFGSGDGKILHFDGLQWTAETVYPGMSVNTLIGYDSLRFVFGNTWKGVPDDSVMYFQKTDGGWILREYQYVSGYFQNSRFGLVSAYAPTREEIFSGGVAKVFRWNGLDWTVAFQAAYNASDLAIGGSGSTNVFAAGNDGTPFVYHFNGIDWHRLSLPSELLPNNSFPYAVWTDGTEVFIVGSTNGMGFALHGK